ncbi:MAG: tryptophan synthase subunit alpha, partial [Phycisphaerales bacterium]
PLARLRRLGLPNRARAPARARAREAAGPRPAALPAAAGRGAGFCALIAPTTPAARAGELARISTGFVYLLARAGVTGERSEAPDVSDRVSRLRDQIDAPIAVGFGISTAQHVRAVGEHADGAIVGSALVRAMLDAVDTGSDPVAAVLNAVGRLR